jgi:hypothetical protein
MLKSVCGSLEGLTMDLCSLGGDKFGTSLDWCLHVCAHMLLARTDGRDLTFILSMT